MTRLTILMGTLGAPMCRLTISILGTPLSLVFTVAPVGCSSVSTATEVTLPISCRPSPDDIGVPVMNNFPGSAFPRLGTVVEVGSFSARVDILL